VAEVTVYAPPDNSLIVSIGPGESPEEVVKIGQRTLEGVFVCYVLNEVSQGRPRDAVWSKLMFCFVRPTGGAVIWFGGFGCRGG
jgi:hypothetical protein